MRVDKKSTTKLNSEVEKCESLIELREILNNNSDYYYEWKNYINRLMERHHTNYVQMAKKCHCSKNTVKKWCREGIMPQNRDAFIKIALGFRLDLEETNRLLQHYGRYPKLYAKNMDDAVCLFVIRHYPKEGDAYECYLQLKQRLLLLLQEAQGETKAGKDTFQIEAGVLSQETQEEFELFVIENRQAFLECFTKLVDYLELFVKAKSDNIHHFVKTNELDFSYEKMLSALKKRGECPNRMRLILLGVNLNMSLEHINEMLSLAYMKPMCAKDNVECIVMYAVESAYLNNPTYDLESAMILQYYDRNPRIQENCKRILREYWDNCVYNVENREDFQYLENNIREYLRYILEQLEWEDEEIYRYL